VEGVQEAGLDECRSRNHPGRNLETYATAANHMTMGCPLVTRANPDDQRQIGTSSNGGCEALSTGEWPGLTES